MNQSSRCPIVPKILKDVLYVVAQAGKDPAMHGVSRKNHLAIQLGIPAFAFVATLLAISFTFKTNAQIQNASVVPADSAPTNRSSNSTSRGAERSEPESSFRLGIGHGPPNAIARFEGTPSPGEVISLRADRSAEASQYRWHQTLGPRVELAGFDSESATFRVPEDADELGFILFVANGGGTDAAEVVVRVPHAPRSSIHRVGLIADAGDDQVGVVGRQITLNGSSSQPRGLVGYRWLQTAGPRVRLEMEEGYFYSFVPQAPGIYQFALVVAREGDVSKPDFVTVSVGNPASPYGLQAQPEAPEAIHDVARAALAEVPGGLDVGESLAEAFDGVADRVDLYRSYAEAYSELSRRLDPVLPGDPVRRGVWNDRLFSPLTARLIEGMRTEGLDLRLPEGQTSPLTSGQRARLAELFRSMSRGFRATHPGP